MVNNFTRALKLLKSLGVNEEQFDIYSKLDGLDELDIKSANKAGRELNIHAATSMVIGLDLMDYIKEELEGYSVNNITQKGSGKARFLIHDLKAKNNYTDYVRLFIGLEK